MKARRRFIVVLCALVAFVFAAFCLGRVLAKTSGYPDLERFSSAKICTWSSDEFAETAEALSSDEEARLREVLAQLRPLGWKADPSTFPPMDGCESGAFLLTLEDGREVRVSDINHHVLAEFIDPPSGSGAWWVSSAAGSSLRELHTSLLSGRPNGS